MKLNREFFLQDVLPLSQALVGKILNMENNGEIKQYRIIETEAYCGRIDKASHAYQNKRTKRTEIMFETGGFIYVYLIYGMYHCFNIVANHEGIPQAVLIRAVEPLNGEEIRFKKDIKTNGPGKLCKHIGIDMTMNKVDLTESDQIFLTDEASDDFEITTSKRINIDYAEEAKDFLWRFYIKNHRFVSKV